MELCSIIFLLTSPLFNVRACPYRNHLEDGVVARAAYFRKNAETCVANAREADGELARATWLDMAARWHKLAQEAELEEGIIAQPPRIDPVAPVVQQQQQS